MASRRLKISQVEHASHSTEDERHGALVHGAGSQAQSTRALRIRAKPFQERSKFVLMQ